MNVRVGRYPDVIGHLWDKIEAKTTSPKNDLLSQQNSIFIPKKQGNKNILNKFQKLFLRLELKTTRKTAYGGLPCKTDGNGDGGGL